MMELTEESIAAAMHSWGLPSHMTEGVVNYLVHRIRPGSFLLAVLEDRLSGAVINADEKNLWLLNGWVGFLGNDVPSPAWGSEEKVREWLKG